MKKVVYKEWGDIGKECPPTIVPLNEEGDF